MGYLVNSQSVEGLSNDAVRRQYIVKVRFKWHFGRPFGFDTLLENMAEAYMAASYQLEEVQNTSRPIGDTTGAVVSRPPPMMVPPTLPSTMLPSNLMPTPHANPMPTPAAAPMALTVPQPMNLDTIAKFREEQNAYIGDVRMIGSIVKIVEKLGVATTVGGQDTWRATVRRIDHHLEEENVGGQDQACLEKI